jgi:hypothetical protein
MTIETLIEKNLSGLGGDFVLPFEVEEKRPS